MGITRIGKNFNLYKSNRKSFSQPAIRNNFSSRNRINFTTGFKFRKHFSNIKIIHSHQTEAERHKTWLKFEQLRTASYYWCAFAFAPVKTLGLIVIDECHEPSFKQDQTPKYSALRASSFLASNFNFKAIFGSATPLIKDYLAELSEKNGGNEIIRLTELKKEAQPAKIELVDLTKKDSKNHRFFFRKKCSPKWSKTL